VQQPAAVTAPAENAVYFELLGIGVLGTFNYERRLGGVWPVRVGVGILPPVFGSDPVAILPSVMAGRLFGPGRHHLEVAAGAEGWVNLRADRRGLLAVGTIGYRYQPPGSSAVFRVAFTPLVALRSPGGQQLDRFTPTGGVSVGYAW
jgi:hypothetical protein